jgi:hypothetical protein
VDLPDVLNSMAEGSITLAGFAAAFRAFSGSHDPDGFSRARLNIVIEGGLVVALLCYLPAWLSSAGVSSDAVWRLTSAVGALWSLFRFAGGAISVYRNASPLPVLYPVVVPVGALSFLSFSGNTVGFLPLSTYSGHLLGTIAMLSAVGLMFIAQFNRPPPNKATGRTKKRAATSYPFGRYGASAGSDSEGELG